MLFVRFTENLIKQLIRRPAIGIVVIVGVE
ncbi:MAG: hypothetical protein HW419_1659, partial [Deltaproteobacteria bacterium]|nr:hypothetical protein [Deltaproteobacteria bacterium]